MLISPEPPEQGQLVKVRGRPWIVSDIRRSSLHSDPLRPISNGAQHLLTLSSVEEDAMGEELRVVWEIEPGASIVEGGGLPEPSGFDEPARLDAFLHAVMWGASSTADYRTLQAPYRSGIQIEDYQLDPVVRAIQMPRANLLVADDVGLGKTIETGLVIQEFITRHRARSVLIVCPSALQLQWRDQMREKFGLEFRVVDSSLLKDLRRKRGIQVNPWTHFPRLITSIDFLKRERPLGLMRAVLPAEGESTYPRRFDVLVVDEAHNVAPSGGGNYATDSLRTQAIRTLAPHFEHRLFLTATPHNGYLESFTALLEILDNQRFARGVQPDESQLRSVMVRRLKSELPPDWDGKPRFPVRDLDVIRVPYSEEEREIHSSLRRYAEERRKAAQASTESYALDFVLVLLKKRLFSSPLAFALTLEKHFQTLSRGRKSSGLAKTDIRWLRRQIDNLEEEFGDDSDYEQATFEALNVASPLLPTLTPEESQLLDRMKSWAEQQRGRPDTKAEQLLDWLARNIKPEGRWSERRVVIFTEYRDTQNWLLDILASRGFSQGDRLMTLYGGMDPDRRERVKAAFQASPEESPVRILLATDAASEGIDLQAHCSRLIHYEIPWNPNRMEQRNGRIDRYGQKQSKVSIFHFVDKDFDEQRLTTNPGDLAGDLEFLYQAVLKLERMERDLFGKVAPVVASQVQEAMLGRRSTLDTLRAEKEAEPVRRMLKFERDLRRQIERLVERLRQTQEELQLTPQSIRSVVETALALAGQPPLEETEVAGIWPDSGGRFKSCPVFQMPRLRHSWAGCLEGLRHPHTGALRPITFDQAVIRGRDDVVLVHLNHRLVQMSLRLLRAEVWAESKLKRLHRVAARTVSDAILETPSVMAHARLVLVGTDGQRLHEEIITAGGFLTEGRFRRMNVGELDRTLGAATEETVDPTMQDRLRQAWPQHRDSLNSALEARMAERAAALQKALAQRAEKETEDARKILNELRRHIRAQLEEEGPAQLELFTSEEKEQLRRNIESLRARIAQIPQEIEQETLAIAARFENPAPHLFPVAVTWLVPHRMAGGGS